VLQQFIFSDITQSLEPTENRLYLGETTNSC
jgi:hypothetical protein